MATLTTRFGEPAAFGAAEAETTRKPGLFSRFFKALQTSREAEARRQIARHQAMIDHIEGLSSRKAANRDGLPF